MQVKGFAPDIAEVRQSLRSFTRPQKNISVKNVVDKVAAFTVLTNKVSMKNRGGGIPSQSRNPFKQRYLSNSDLIFNQPFFFLSASFLIVFLSYSFIYTAFR